MTVTVMPLICLQKTAVSPVSGLTIICPLGVFQVFRPRPVVLEAQRAGPGPMSRGAREAADEPDASPKNRGRRVYGWVRPEVRGTGPEGSGLAFRGDCGALLETGCGRSPEIEGASASPLKPVGHRGTYCPV